MATSYWGVDHGDSVSKADKEYTPWKSFKSQGLAFKDKDARKKVMTRSAKNYYSRDTAATVGRHTVTGAGIGAAAGALASRGHNTKVVAGGGAYLGAMGGIVTGSQTSSNNAKRKAVRGALRTGQIKRTDKKVSYWGGMEKS